ncbi:MAG: transglutaminase-like domain-containing protein [Candidatus Methanofastidiosum sp.]|nr:transglutaminase-like domain-containing protein [Methanofastidiosum sp.]
MMKRFFVVSFFIFGIILFSFMFMSETHKLNFQIKSNYQIEEKIMESYLELQETNSTLMEKGFELEEMVQYKDKLNEEELFLLESQNKLNQEISSYKIYESKDPRIFVDLNDSLVTETLNQIITPSMGNAEKARAIFNYARDEIKKDDKLIRNGRIDYWNYPKNIIQSKKGEYEDKIILLVSMLRASGFSENDVEVVGAKINLLNSTSSDIWVELKLNGNIYLLLPRENNNFDSFNKNDIYKVYSVEELFRFNDKKLMRS